MAIAPIPAEFHHEGVALRGWFARPNNEADTPVIILQHGLSGIASLDLPEYAEYFVAAGFACFAYDHRNWGKSAGEPRGESDPWQQVADLRAAISFVRNQAWVDSNRIGLWGTSYGGGHVLTVTALDNRIRCAVSQVPLVSGSRTFELWIPAEKHQAMLKNLSTERDARMRGDKPITVPPAREGSDTEKWVTSKDKSGHYVNELTLLSFDHLRSYEPISFAAQITRTPLMIIVASDDTQTPVSWQKEAFASITAPAKLVEIEGEHYDVYLDKLDEAAMAAQSWFVENL
ncbi:MAG: alpha/beta fold hydrolase [Pseudomonadota bacterium]